MSKPDFDAIVAKLKTLEHNSTERFGLLWEAITAFDPAHPETLAAMLQSSDREILGDALYIIY